jgi:hypothetical protein
VKRKPQSPIDNKNETTKKAKGGKNVKNEKQR